MFSLTFEQFEVLSKKGNLIPLYREIPADLDTPVLAFLKIQSGKNDFLLESVVGGEKWGRYSFFGSDPSAIFRSRGDEVEIIRGHRRAKMPVLKDPLQSLRDFLSAYVPVPMEGTELLQALPGTGLPGAGLPGAGLPRFFGGAVGFFSYDMVRHFEKLPLTAKNELDLYDSYFMITDTVVIFDNRRQVMQVVANLHVEPDKQLKQIYEEGIHKIERLVQKLKGGTPTQYLKRVESGKVGKMSQELSPLHSEEEFCALVERAKEYIRAGDIFQVQISTRFEEKTDIPPFALYRVLRRLNPSPYLYFLQYDDMALVGASPEVMVRMEEGKVELRPIAGTRRRGKDVQEDAKLEEELKNDPKERAEHIMLVDLGRNDLGRVCEAGTVKVDEQEVVERYSRVMHLVSQVSGRVRKGINVFDVLKATFPAGTLTGAPKIRAMEIIEELEGKRRGVYGGAVGYISFNGNMDMAITIRTALFYKGKITIQAAAGIVTDSIPRLEYKECQNKARAMLDALTTVNSDL